MVLSRDDIAELRGVKESMHLDRCRVTRPGARGDLDPDTLKYPAAAAAVIYEGPCRLPRRDPSVGPADAGDATWEVGEYPFAVPVGLLPGATGDPAAVAPGMTVVVLDAALDPSMVGLEFGVTAIGRQTLATERRFRMKQVVS